MDTIDKIDTEKLKEAVDLRDLAGRLVTLTTESKKGGELSGPCPKCHGRDRFHVTASMFFCRACFPLGNGKPHDAIEFVTWAGLAHDFVGAAAYLAGGAAGAVATAPRTPEPKQATVKSWQLEAWQREARSEVNAAQERLYHADGEPGRQYLVQRGTALDVAAVWGLGFALVYHSKRKEHLPALVIPWEGRGIIKAIQYRFVGLAGGERFSQKAGGERTIYGADLISGAWDTLLAVEGELNAVAIWQALADIYHPGATPVDVVSFGTESNAAAVLELAKRYRRAIVWADKREITAKMLQALPAAKGLQSPIIDGQKHDANDLLRAGRLGAILEALSL